MANEKRLDLIDRRQLLKELRKELRECRADGEEMGGESILWAEGIEFAIDTVKQTKKADAVEVVHGHWISKGYKIECSACEHKAFIGTTDPVIHREEKNICKYCPNCGARMDGERKGNE